MSFLTFSCEKESGNNTDSQSQLIINNESNKIDKALVMNWGQFDGRDESYEGYRMIVGLYSPEVSILTANNEVEGLTGTGHGVEFELFSESTQTIASKEFKLSSDYKVNTFSFAVVYHNFPFDTGEMMDGDFISGGSLTVELKNGMLTLSSTLTLVSGEEVTIHYSGSYIFLEP